MGWPLRVGIRNGDSSSNERSKQLKAPPQILITTPESLTLCSAIARPKSCLASSMPWCSMNGTS